MGRKYIVGDKVWEKKDEYHAKSTVSSITKVYSKGVPAYGAWHKRKLLGFYDTFEEAAEKIDDISRDG